MNQIKWTIYWTKKPGRSVVNPAERDFGYTTVDINKAYSEIEHLEYNNNDEWAGYVEEWKPDQ